MTTHRRAQYWLEWVLSVVGVLLAAVALLYFLP